MNQSVLQWLGVAGFAISAVALWRVETRVTAESRVCAATNDAAPHRDAPSTSIAELEDAGVVAPQHIASPAPLAAPAPVAVHAPGIAPHAIGTFEVRRFVVARDVHDRTPVDPGTVLHVGPSDRVFAFLEAANHTGESEPVMVTFERADTHATVSEVQLDVPAQPHWRTWGFTRMVHVPGTYTAVARTLDGHEVARADFQVG